MAPSGASDDASGGLRTNRAGGLDRRSLRLHGAADPAVSPDRGRSQRQSERRAWSLDARLVVPNGDQCRRQELQAGIRAGAPDLRLPSGQNHGQKRRREETPLPQPDAASLRAVHGRRRRMEHRPPDRGPRVPRDRRPSCTKTPFCHSSAPGSSVRKVSEPRQRIRTLLTPDCAQHTCAALRFDVLVNHASTPAGLTWLVQTRPQAAFSRAAIAMNVRSSCVRAMELETPPPGRARGTTCTGTLSRDVVCCRIINV